MATTVRSQQQAINRIREEGLRNERIIGVASVGAAAGLRVEADPSLHHALLNVLNNAADVSPEDVRLEAAREGDRLLLRVACCWSTTRPFCACSVARWNAAASP